MSAPRHPSALVRAAALLTVVSLAVFGARAGEVSSEEAGPVRLAGEAPAEDVRPAALAGTWYPAESEVLAGLVDGLLERAPARPADGADVRAILVPHAAYRWSGTAAAAAYRQVQGQAPRRVVLLGPSHRTAVRGLALPRQTAFETPLGRIPLDRDALERIGTDPLAAGDPGAHRLEHSLEVQLPFLQRTLAPGWQLVPVLVGHLEPGDDLRAAELLRPLLDAGTLLVVSGDLTHYGEAFGYRPFPIDGEVKSRLEALDLGAFERLSARDADGLAAYGDRTGITACALEPARVLARLLPEGARVERVSYYTSGDLTGDYRHSVSYIGAVFRWADARSGSGDGAAGAGDGAARLSDAGLAYLHALASTVVEASAAPGNGAEARLERLLAGLPEELQRPAGVFVTLREGHALRGCVGTVQADRPVYLATLANAVNASRNDGRFPPVAPDEVPRLTVEVSVLSATQPVGSWQDVQVGQHGVLLAKDGRRAVFLPEVATEQGWGREETLSQLARKAGLDADAWREGAEIAVFTTQHYTSAGASVGR